VTLRAGDFVNLVLNAEVVEVSVALQLVAYLEISRNVAPALADGALLLADLDLPGSVTLRTVLNRHKHHPKTLSLSTALNHPQLITFPVVLWI